MQKERRIVALLACSQALLLTNGILLVAVSGLAGLGLASDRRLATAPLTTYVLGSAIATVPASYFMKRYGRRNGFALGALFGMAGGALGAVAILVHSFELLCAATLCSGAYNAFGQYYRFAAADAASTAWKSKAISLTLAGGLAGAFAGPAIGQATRDLAEPRFVATFLAIAALALPALAIAAALRMPKVSEEEQRERGRPLAAIARQPAFVVAVLAAAIGYGVMNLLMSATPIAMDMCGLQFGDTAQVLQWHVVGMFAPSFVTGSLIRRFGVLEILLAGCGLMFACVAIALQGLTLAHFVGSLLLLGVGWNFLYIGGTTLLTETYTPAEKAKTQGFNDLLVSGSMIASSLASGAVVTDRGWATLNQLALPLLTATALGIALLRFGALGQRRPGDC